ncbi:MAG: WbqC family protein [Paludibacteraceae bacterium]|nr:WbqC family protein [Paludibacteraceae bacterium]
MAVVPTTYLGPLSWFAQLPAEVEVNESFEKQTYRNRCLLRNNIRLTVPVCKVESKQLTRDIEISYQQHWQHQHWMAIRSAYEHTPYFLYYEDYLRPFYERETKYLIDLNSGLTEVIWHLLHNTAPLNANRSPLHYTQDWSSHTWTDAHPWQNEMSILDTLFEKGPETLIG